jgi:hypothetical protein
MTRPLHAASPTKYAVALLTELSEAKAEIAMLRDIVVTYGDKVRMANAARPEWQEVIDRAFERDN